MVRMVEGSKRYQVIGLAGTLIWAVLIAIYLCWKGVNPLDLQPNEFGDFLAGVLGPLGILWIVLGFWQQGDELRSSVTALNLQSQELNSSVEQQRALVEVTREKAEAEVRAIAEERRSRRRAIAPRFLVATDGGHQSSAKVSTRFSLKNAGSDAFFVSIQASSKSESIFDCDIPMVSRGGSLKFDYEYQFGEEEAFLLVIRTSDREDYSSEIRYFISPEGGVHRFSIIEESVGTLSVD